MSQKILCFSTAFNNTFVFSQVIKPGETESIVHVNADGEILFEYKYDDIINSFGMLSEKEVIVMDVPRNHVDIVNLEERKVYSFQHKYLFEDVAQMCLETFHETGLFCIIEKGTFNDHRLKLTYYDYKQVHDPQNCKPVAEFQSAGGQWTYEHPVRRANNHSMIAWFKQRHEAEIEFHYFDLRADPKGKMETVRVANTIGQPYGMVQVQMLVATMWQTVPGEFLLVTNTNKCEVNARNHHNVINNNFIVSKDMGVIRETNFDFPHKDEQDFAWNDQLIEYFNIGRVSVFHTFRHKQGQTLQTPVYYVDNHTEKIVGEEAWFATCYVNFYLPGWDGSTLVKAKHTNCDVDHVEVTVVKIPINQAQAF